MSEAVSALNGARFEGLVRIRDAGPRGMITVRGDLSGAVKDAASEMCGTGFPERMGCSLDGNRDIAWMSPDEILLMVPYAEAAEVSGKLADRLSGEHALVANVSDARTVFVIEGAGLREVIAKLAPVDMAPGQFDPGVVRRTRLAQVPAAFWLTDETTLELVCFRSVAHYVYDLLCVSARAGTEIGVFEPH